MKKFFKEHGFNLIMLIIFLTGIAIVAYPTLSDYWNSRVQSKVISNYKQMVSNSSENLQQIKTAAQIYNQTLFNVQNTGASSEGIASYDEILNIAGDSVMGYIEIPVISVELPIYHGTEDKILQVAVGHSENSSVPVGGENTHAVLLGHRGLPSARLFNDLDQLTTGDYFEIHVLDEVLCYEIYKIETVEPKELNNLRIKAGEDIVTLVTCTPYGINTHRLLVHGRRIEMENVRPLVGSEGRRINKAYVAIAIGLVLWCVTMGTVMYISSRRQRVKISREEYIRRYNIISKYRK